MQVSSVNYTDLNPEFRIDAEYYRAEILERLSILEGKNNNILDDLVDFIVGPFGSTVTVDKYIEHSNYRYIRNKDINDFRISNQEAASIPEDVWSSLPQFHIQNNDLLITVVGTLGKVAIATEDDNKSIFSCKSTILRARNINPFYLLAYLNSPTGKLLSLRGKRGVIQEGLNLTDLKEIRIFIPSVKFQLTIEKIIRVSFEKADQSKEKYKASQDILLSELGLNNWKPKHKLTFIKNYSQIKQAGRMDADYFQPKYDEVVNAIKSCSSGWDTLGNFATIKKCVEVGSEEYRDEGIPFVRVSNLTPFEITEDKYISESLYEEIKQHQPKKGEILFSKDATPGIAYHIQEEPDRIIPSGGILRLQRKDDRVNSDFLTLVLNSLLTKQQVERDVGGSVILHWRPDQVKETLIPILEDEKQAEIQQKIKKAFDLRKQSKHLLECAKQAVETAIEQDEKTAMQWLENETSERQI